MSLLKQFQESHRHPVNRVCHVAALALLAAAFSFFPVQWGIILAVVLVASGLLIFGHHVEGRYPAVLHRFIKKILRGIPR